MGEATIGAKTGGLMKGSLNFSFMTLQIRNQRPALTNPLPPDTPSHLVERLGKQKERP